MTKLSLTLFATLLLSLTIFGCSEAPPTATNSPALPVEAPATEAPLLPSRWIEDIHYNVVAEQATEQQQVVEFFSFWCPACYRFESVVTRIKSQLSDGIAFQKVHVNFMGFTSKEIQEQVTKAMLVGRALGQEELMNAAIFGHIHEQKQKIEGINDLEQLFVSYDIAKTDFNNILNSDNLNSAFASNNAEIAKFKSHLNGVPNIIVNGKYQAIFTRDMTIQDIVELINWLSQQK